MAPMAFAAANRTDARSLHHGPLCIHAMDSIQGYTRARCNIGPNAPGGSLGIKFRRRGEFKALGLAVPPPFVGGQPGHVHLSFGPGTRQGGGQRAFALRQAVRWCLPPGCPRKLMDHASRGRPFLNRALPRSPLAAVGSAAGGKGQPFPFSVQSDPPRGTKGLGNHERSPPPPP